MVMFIDLSSRFIAANHGCLLTVLVLRSCLTGYRQYLLLCKIRLLLLACPRWHELLKAHHRIA